MSIIDKPIVKTLMLKGEKGENGTAGEPGGSPLVASSTSEMTDTTKVYVNTTDGHWYYYDGSSWSDGSVTYQKLADDINFNFEVEYSDNLGTITNGKYQPRVANYGLSDSSSYKVCIADVSNLSKIYVTTTLQSNSLDCVTFFGSNNVRTAHLTLGPAVLDHEEYEVPANSVYVVINGRAGAEYECSVTTRKYKVKESTTELYNVSDEIIHRLSIKQLGALNKGYICLVADDGHEEAVTNTFPIIASKNVPVTFACWSESEIIANATYFAQLKNLIENYGCAVCQHGATSFLNFTKSNLVRYLRSEKEFWENNDVNVVGLCYPNHEHNDYVMAVAGSMFDVACTGGVQTETITGTKVLYDYDTNGARTNMYELYRKSLYSRSLAELKQSVDYAYANNKIIIVFWHDTALTGDTATKLESLIDYAVAKGIEFINVNDIPTIM